jgi:hypothetical protein
MTAGKQVCKKHQWAHLIGTECHWCVPDEPIEVKLPVPTFYGNDNSLGLFDIFPFGYVSYIEGDPKVGKSLFGDAMLECIADGKPVCQFSTQAPTTVTPVFVCSRTRTPYQGVLDIRLGTYSAFLAYASLSPSVFVNSLVVFDSDVTLDMTPSMLDAANFHSNFIFLTTKVDPLDYLDASTVLKLTRSPMSTIWNFSIKKSIDPGLIDFMIDYARI